MDANFFSYALNADFLTLMRAVLTVAVFGAFWAYGWSLLLNRMQDLLQPRRLWRVLFLGLRVLVAWTGPTALLLLGAHAIFRASLDVGLVALVTGLVLVFEYFRVVMKSGEDRSQIVPNARNATKKTSAAWWFAIPAALTILVLTWK